MSRPPEGLPEQCRKGAGHERCGTTAPGGTGAAAENAPARVPLGRTSLEVTRFVLGCAPIAGLFHPVSKEDANATFAAAWDGGVRAFDTAPHYGGGLSERRLGAFLATKPHDEVVLSTKVGRLLVEDEERSGGSEFVGERGVRRELDYSGDGARRSLEESLGRLGMDRIDIALVHDADDHLDEALAGAFPALRQLREEGVVAAIGAGMNNCPPLLRIVERADVDCILVAGRYNLLDQQAGEQLLAACAVAVLVAGVFASEVLANPVPNAHFRYEPASEEIVSRAQRIAAVCAEHGVPLAAAAINFPFTNPAVTAAVVGARRATEVEEDLAYLVNEVPSELYDELRRLELIART
jgi:aryl-alcohol dehydrogenase-like predicted oxidoreductase